MSFDGEYNTFLPLEKFALLTYLRLNKMGTTES